MKTLASDRDAAELLRRLRALREDSVGRWGRMSAHQMVCHLSDGYRLLTGELTSPLAATPLPRQVMKWVALYVPTRWPKDIPTTPELDQAAGGGTRPIDFARDVAALEQLLATVAAERSARLTGIVHPIFGSMSEPAWLRWAYLHADHHLRQFGV
jgi:Protein of unknown function (DUF1569)